MADDDLSEWHRVILLYLETEGRSTPGLIRKYVERDGLHDPVPTRQFFQQQLASLEDDGHVENVLESGVYELVDDPRE